MPEQTFNTSLADSQGTLVDPLSPDKFDLSAYEEYEAALLEKNEYFWKSSSGLAIHRRVRVPEVFSYTCKDMHQSLALQLGALRKSMSYQMDIPNFLEPWYGIGTAASAFGVDYQWDPGQAPGIRPSFKTVDEALKQELVPVEETPIGKYTLQMIEYFLDQTKGKVPISPTDTQASLNAAALIVETNHFFLEFIMNPEGLKELLIKFADLTIDFTKKQMALIGDALALPGHGFASSKKFSGLGVSSDNIAMISNEDYQIHEGPCIEKIGNVFSGAVFHSCGNWANKIEGVKSIPNLVMIDGAFTKATDPAPNPCEPFRDAFSGTGVIVNARMVGTADRILEKVKQLWTPGMKVIVVTYCETPEEQADVYNQVHQWVEK